MTTPALHRLMGTYFHQDWDIFGSTHMEVVDRFGIDEPELAAALPAEIDHVLSTVHDEAGLGDYLDSLGCDVWADPDSGGYRQWLAHIAAHVRQRLPQG